MKTALVILSIPADSERTNNILPVTAPGVEHYCERHNIELVRIKDLGQPLVPHVLQCERLKLLFCFEEYERFIFMDDTCIIAPECPNLFDLVPENKLGCVVEPPEIFPDSEQRLLQSLDTYQVTSFNSHYFNAGMLVFSQTHKIMFDHIHLFRPSEKWDQDYFNAMVHMFRLEIHDLGLSYNYPGSLILKNIDSDFGGLRIFIYHLTRACGGEQRKLEYGQRINERIALANKKTTPSL